jgi:hypothetical protein
MHDPQLSILTSRVAELNETLKKVAANLERIAHAAEKAAPK